jgi:hypothetical protein
VRKIRRLRDLRKQGTQAEQDFVRYLVASQLDTHPDAAAPEDWERAWREAQNFWEKTVQDFDKELEEKDLREAERRAQRQLSRIAHASLNRLGWT